MYDTACSVCTHTAIPAHAFTKFITVSRRIRADGTRVQHLGGFWSQCLSLKHCYGAVWLADTTSDMHFDYQISLVVR
jgi:hypothetical protein